MAVEAAPPPTVDPESAELAELQRQVRRAESRAQRAEESAGAARQEAAAAREETRHAAERAAEAACKEARECEEELRTVRLLALRDYLEKWRAMTCGSNPGLIAVSSSSPESAALTRPRPV